MKGRSAGARSTRREATAARRALEAVLRGEPAVALPGGFAEAAATHGVTGATRRRLLEAGGAPPALLAELDALRLTGLRTHVAAVAELARLDDALAGVGAPWLVVKGPVAAETIHVQPDLRTYGDVDLVVPARSFADAVRALEAHGGVVQGHNWWHRLERLAGEVPVVMPSGTVIDVHWHLVNNIDVRRALRLSMPDLFERAVEVDVRGTRVGTLDPVDTALHLCIHCTTSGADRLVWLLDVHELAVRNLVDWGELVSRARATRSALPAAVTLAKARAVLRTPVPVDVVAALDPARVWRALAAVGRRVPRRTPDGRYDTLERAVAKATRGSTPESLRALASRVLSRHAPDDDVTSAPRDHDPDAREEGRQRYFEAVTREM